MRLRLTILSCVAVLAVFARCWGADELRPVVGPGATRDEVIAAYGWPNGQSHSGNKEILSYAQGEVILQDGRVERVNFSPDVPWQAPKPPPAPPTASTRKVPEAPVDFWLTDFGAAKAEATRRQSRILALFTGSDWSPASKQFHEEVEDDPAFVNAFAGDFVFLRLDYPRGNPVPAQISPEKLQLRDHYGVTVYPTVLILGADGELLARVDLSQTASNRSFRDRVIAAVAAARDAGRTAGPVTASASSLSPAAKPTSPVPRPSVASAVAAAAPRPVARGIRRATLLVIGALAAGGLAVGFILWRLWRPRQPGLSMPVREVATRIDDAAGGIPSRAEMAQWPREKLRAIVAALAKFDNYEVRGRSTGDVDLEFRRRGDTKARVLVVCSPGSAGTVPARIARELFGSMAAEGAEVGWVVSPGEFAADTTAYAAAHRIVLVNAEGLHAMMRDVPPVSLPGVLARG